MYYLLEICTFVHHHFLFWQEMILEAILEFWTTKDTILGHLHDQSKSQIL